ncbi:unnamed protein product [Durusdinium trenchii]|uniref:Uncharacterized protein n=1 Tax=Durusdinium trenchii TaxID=1381693 RepID=A0ABP0QEN7_9DINO|eukprot:g5159.t1
MPVAPGVPHANLLLLALAAVVFVVGGMYVESLIAHYAERTAEEIVQTHGAITNTSGVGGLVWRVVEHLLALLFVAADVASAWAPLIAALLVLLHRATALHV